MTNTSRKGFEQIRKRLEEDGADLLCDLLQILTRSLMSAEADAACGAGYRERSDERTDRRNGYRRRRWDTRVGSIELAIPKLREGTWLPDWLLGPRRRAEKALSSVIAESYAQGGLDAAHGLPGRLPGHLGTSGTQVSERTRSLGETVADLRQRFLDGGPYPYLILTDLSRWGTARTYGAQKAGSVALAAGALRRSRDPAGAQGLDGAFRAAHLHGALGSGAGPERSDRKLVRHLGERGS